MSAQVNRHLADTALRLMDAIGKRYAAKMGQSPLRTHAAVAFFFWPFTHAPRGNRNPSMTRIQDIMTAKPHTLAATDTLQSAATSMASHDIGSLPVCEQGKPIGIVTDRDIAVRGVAKGLPPTTGVRDVMTTQLHTCQAATSVEQVLAAMGDAQVRRLLVVDDAGQLVGIVALGDLATRQSKDVDEALREISRPS